MLATRISLHERARQSGREAWAPTSSCVRHGIGSDPRIGYHFLYPGCGYGGSCFPKDVQALQRTARRGGHESADPRTRWKTANDAQKHVLRREDRRSASATTCTGKHFALWGLAFKPNTDDMREAPSRVLIADLLARGATRHAPTIRSPWTRRSASIGDEPRLQLRRLADGGARQAPMRWPSSPSGRNSAARISPRIKARLQARR